MWRSQLRIRRDNSNNKTIINNNKGNQARLQTLLAMRTASRTWRIRNVTLLWFGSQYYPYAVCVPRQQHRHHHHRHRCAKCIKTIRHFVLLPFAVLFMRPPAVQQCHCCCCCRCLCFLVCFLCCFCCTLRWPTADNGWWRCTVPVSWSCHASSGNSSLNYLCRTSFPTQFPLPPLNSSSLL